MRFLFGQDPRSVRVAPLALALALAACGGNTTPADTGVDVATSDARPGTDAAPDTGGGADVATMDAPRGDAPSVDTGSSDAPPADTTTVDAPRVDVAVTDVSRPDAPAGDTAVTPDASRADAGMCAPQDATGEGPCDRIFGYAWNGTSCVGVSGCRCVGADCGSLPLDRDVCIRAHAGCSSTSDCRTTGCRSGTSCMPCRGPGGLVYACIPDGAAC